MGRRGTIAVGIALIAVATAYWLLPADDRARRPGVGAGMTDLIEPTKAVTPLMVAAASQVQTVRLTLRGETRSTRRIDQGWSDVTRPHFIDDFLEDLTKLGTLSDLDVEANELGQFGLSEPRGVLEIEGSAGRRLILEIGDRNPSTTGLYVRFPESGKVALVGALVGWDFEKAFAAIGPVGSPSPIP